MFDAKLMYKTKSIRRPAFLAQLAERPPSKRKVTSSILVEGMAQPFLKGTTASTAFCLLYKLWTLRLTIKQVSGLIDHPDSPHIRALGFLYLRYVCKPADLWEWFEDYLDDEEDLQIQAGPRPVTITIGRMCRQLLTETKWLGTFLPRIPVPIARDIELKLKEKLQPPPPPPRRESPIYDLEPRIIADSGTPSRHGDDEGDYRRSRTRSRSPDGSSRSRRHRDNDRNHREYRRDRDSERDYGRRRSRTPDRDRSRRHRGSGHDKRDREHERRETHEYDRKHEDQDRKSRRSDDKGNGWQQIMSSRRDILRIRPLWCVRILTTMFDNWSDEEVWDEESLKLIKRRSQGQSPGTSKTPLPSKSRTRSRNSPGKRVPSQVKESPLKTSNKHIGVLSLSQTTSYAPLNTNGTPSKSLSYFNKSPRETLSLRASTTKVASKTLFNYFPRQPSSRNDDLISNKVSANDCTKLLRDEKVDKSEFIETIEIQTRVDSDDFNADPTWDKEYRDIIMKTDDDENFSGKIFGAKDQKVKIKQLEDPHEMPLNSMDMEAFILTCPLCDVSMKGLSNQASFIKMNFHVNQCLDGHDVEAPFTSPAPSFNKISQSASRIKSNNQSLSTVKLMPKILQNNNHENSWSMFFGSLKNKVTPIGITDELKGERNPFDSMEEVRYESNPDSITQEVRDESSPDSITQEVRDANNPDSITQEVRDESNPDGITKEVRDEKNPDSITQEVRDETNPDGITKEVRDENNPDSITQEVRDESNPDGITKEVRDENNPDSITQEVRDESNPDSITQEVSVQLETISNNEQALIQPLSIAVLDEISVPTEPITTTKEVPDLSMNDLVFEPPRRDAFDLLKPTVVTSTIQSKKKQCPWYKIMPETEITVDAFSYGKIPNCSAYFLSHFHSDHYSGLTSKWSHGPIYCSAVTGNMVIQRLGVKPQYIHKLPLNQEVDVNGNGVSVTLIEANHCPGSVLFLFKIMNAQGRILRYLHTGDFRASPRQVTHESIDQSKNPPIDMLYLDTTYLDPTHCFPPQDHVVQAVVDLLKKVVKNGGLLSSNQKGKRSKAPLKGQTRLDRWFNGLSYKNVLKLENKSINNTEMTLSMNSSEEHKFELCEKDSRLVREKRIMDLHDIVELDNICLSDSKILVVVGAYLIGKEKVFMGIAKALHSKIYVTNDKRRILLCQENPELESLLTDDPLQASVHVMSMQSIKPETLTSYLQDLAPTFKSVIGFRPTGWAYNMASNQVVSPSATSEACLNHYTSYTHECLKPSRKSPTCQIFDVPYSEHSSFRELAAFVLSLNIKKIIPTVNLQTEKSRAEMNIWLNKWQNEKRKNGKIVRYPSLDHW
ncbi:hypothetical protein G9A89_009517 [Geosiphon pyriformis]|nr:hypothetical protein G9A89_009517 [Geosiphon pyriformis]